MKSRCLRAGGALWLALTALAPTPCYAAFAAFLRIEGVEGGSTDPMHFGEIDVLAIHWGLQGEFQVISPGGPTPGAKVTFDALSVTKPLDQASPILAQGCASGTVFPSAVLTLFTIGDKAQRFMKYKFNGVIVSAVDVGGAAQGSDSVPTENVSFLYSKIQFIFTTIGPDGKPTGNVSGGWDLTQNRP